MRAAAARDSGVGGTSSDSGGACCADGGEVVESDRKTHGLSRQTAQLSVGFSLSSGLPITKPMLRDCAAGSRSLMDVCLLSLDGTRGYGSKLAKAAVTKSRTQKNEQIEELRKSPNLLRSCITCRRAERHVFTVLVEPGPTRTHVFPQLRPAQASGCGR